MKLEDKVSSCGGCQSLETRTTTEKGLRQDVASDVHTNSDRTLNSDLALTDFDTCALSSDNFLHAGTQLKHTKQVFAVCVYGGPETKVNG